MSDTAISTTSGRSAYPTALPPNHELTKTIVQARSFLPLLRLMGASSKPVKTKKIGVDHFALTSGENMEDLGTQVIAIAFAYRHAASILTQDPSTGKKKMYSNYDFPSAKFKEIEAEAEKKTDGYFWGFDFLVWLPKQKKFAILPLNNPTNRNSQPDFEARLGQVIVIDSQEIHTAKHDWSGIVCSGYQGALDPESEPSNDEVNVQLAKFQMSGETTDVAPEQEGVKASATAQTSTRG